MLHSPVGPPWASVLKPQVAAAQRWAPLNQPTRRPAANAELCCWEPVACGSRTVTSWCLRLEDSGQRRGPHERNPLAHAARIIIELFLRSGLGRRHGPD